MTRRRQDLVERPALDIIQHNIPVIGIGKMIVEAGNAIVAQAGQQGGLAIIGVGGLDLLLRRECGHVDLFDGNEFAALILIARFVDDAEAALADLLKDAIVPGQ